MSTISRTSWPLQAPHRFVAHSKTSRRLKVSTVMLAALFAVAAAFADWPEFRGPTSDGYASPPGSKTVGFPLTWSETNHIKWKTEIPFKGWATPVILGNQIWLTTATEAGHDYFAICVDKESGKILFNEKVFHTDTPEPLGNGAAMNCYATPSPVIEPGRVYVHFGSAGTACLDTKTAKVLWKRTDLPCRHYRGASSSPIGFENLLILTFDGADRQYHAALDKQTGATVWQTNRSVKWNDENVPGPLARDGDLRKAHSTPFIARVGGEPLMLSAGAKAAYGYAPRTGSELWRVEHNDYSAAPRPLFANGLAYLVTGHPKRELLAVKVDGRGVVTDTHIAWRLGSRVPRYASPLLVDGLIYLAAEESFLSCVEAATGAVVWTERVGGKFASSPIYADGRLYFFSQEGVTTVVKPGRTYEALATNALDGGFMASPAADGRAFYLRTRTHLYRVEAASVGE